jgi:predicted nucleotidyltransferase
MSKDIQQIQEKIVPILKRAGVLRSSIFGSVARGEAAPESDVDILVELPHGKSLFDLVDLKTSLETILGKKVDVGTYNSIKPRIKERVFAEAIQIYEG